jgi:plasmid replication initiation protein
MKIEEKRQLVVKDHALINAAYTLDLVEQRLILMSIVAVRDSDKVITAELALTVRAEDYASQFNVTRQAAYMALKEASDGLFDRYFSYQKMSEKGNVEHVKSRWVSAVSYIDAEAAVNIKFAADVIPLITRLEKQFTSYDLEQVSGLSSTFAVRLYEQLMTWRSTGKTPEISLADLRDRLGVMEGNLTRIDNFKRKVLDFAIRQVNEHTNMTASYEQHKRGRIVSGFSFSFTIKAPPEPAEPPAVEGSSKKRKKITKAEAQAMARPGEHWPELYARLGTEYLIV